MATLFRQIAESTATVCKEHSSSQHLPPLVTAEVGVGVGDGATELTTSKRLRVSAVTPAVNSVPGIAAATTASALTTTRVAAALLPAAAGIMSSVDWSSRCLSYDHAHTAAVAATAAPTFSYLSNNYIHPIMSNSKSISSDNGAVGSVMGGDNILSTEFAHTLLSCGHDSIFCTKVSRFNNLVIQGLVQLLRRDISAFHVLVQTSFHCKFEDSLALSVLLQSVT